MEPIYPCDETFDILEKYLQAIPTDREIKKDGVSHAADTFFI